MAKVVYSISRRNWNSKLTGVGELSDGTLRIRTQKGEEMVFEDILKYCHPILTRPNQFSGYMTLAYEDVPVYDERKGNYSYVDYMEVEYHIWFKYMA